MSIRRPLLLFAALAVTALTAPASASAAFGYLTQWGSDGTGTGQFGFALDVAVDNAGTVYVLDSNRRKVLAFTSTGGFLREWGTEGSGAGQIDGVDALDTDSAGNVYVGENQSGPNPRVQKFSPTGTLLDGWGGDGEAEGQFGEVDDVHVDDADNIYVSDGIHKRIQKFNTGGGFALMWGWGVNDGGNAFQTCISSCQKGIAGEGNGQWGLADGIATHGTNVYVSDQNINNIQKFTTNGAFLARWNIEGEGDGQLANPEHMATDPATGNLWVADGGNSRVQLFSPAGQFLAKIDAASGVGPIFPRAVATDAAGNLYIADPANSRIVKFGEGGAGPGGPGGGGASNAFTIGKVAVAAKKGTVTITLNLPGAGAVNAVATAKVAAGLLAKKKKITVASKKATATAAGPLKIKLKAKKKAKKVLKKKGKLKSSVKITFTPTGGTAKTSTKKATFKLTKPKKKKG